MQRCKLYNKPKHNTFVDCSRFYYSRAAAIFSICWNPNHPIQQCFQQAKCIKEFHMNEAGNWHLFHRQTLPYKQQMKKFESFWLLVCQSRVAEESEIMDWCFDHLPCKHTIILEKRSCAKYYNAFLIIIQFDECLSGPGQFSMSRLICLFNLRWSALKKLTA